MDLLVLIGIVVTVLAGVSALAYLRRIALATERVADAVERGADRRQVERRTTDPAV